MSELPQIANASYTLSTGIDTGTLATNGAETTWLAPSPQWQSFRDSPTNSITANREEGKVSESKRRIVQVFIVDPDKRVPLQHALLYRGEQKMTDATDKELFFEINVKELLDKHNNVRKELRDYDASVTAGRDVYLKAARIRDLKMVVVNVALF